MKFHHFYDTECVQKTWHKYFTTRVTVPTTLNSLDTQPYFVDRTQETDE
jgi:hypothetical protein